MMLSLLERKCCLVTRKEELFNLL